MRRSVGRVVIITMMALCVIVSADEVLAQDALLVGGRFYSASRDFGQELTPLVAFVDQKEIFGGGRYAMVDGIAFDGRTGGSFLAPGEVLATDRARPRFFVRRATGVALVSLPGISEILIWQGDGTRVQRCSFAYSADELICGVLRNDGLTDVIAVDLATSPARTVAAVDLSPGFGAWIATSDGRRLYFGQDAGDNKATLSVLNMATGAMTSTSAPGQDSNRAARVILDEVNERVISIGAPGVTVLSEDLAVIGVASFGSLTSVRGYAVQCANVAISPHSGRLYLGLSFDKLGGGGPATLHAFDAATYASVSQEVSIFQYFKRQPCSMAVLTAPGAPKDLAGTVTGSQIGLTWTNVGGASSFVVDVGLAPGRTDLQIPLGADAHATFTSVPSGIYYVRLRARNEHGGSHSSSEIKLVVP